MSAPYVAQFAVSVYTSPRPLGKRLSVREDGGLRKESMGSITSGTVQTVTFRSLSDFARHRHGLTTSQALGYGLTAYPLAHLTTKGDLASLALSSRMKGRLPLVARDSSHFSFADGPGLMMLDHDPAVGHDPMSAEQFRDALRRAMPELRQVSMLWASSTGSMIYDGERQIVGLQGSRIYLVVSRARDIPSVGRLLFDRLTLSGHGRVVISGSGRMLRRGPIDASVWQAERLDYVHATCGGGLVQRPAPWLLFSGEEDDSMFGDTMLDVSKVRALDPAEAEELEAIWSRLSASSAEESRMVRRSWAAAAARTAAERAGAPICGQSLALQTQRFEVMARTLVLERSHVLQLASGQTVTVGDLTYSQGVVVEQ